ncbi:VOC family protein [Chloroflexota bacterium]
MADNEPVIQVTDSFDVECTVKNLEKTVEFLTNVFGLGPWQRGEVDRTLPYKGRQVNYKGPRAHYKLGPVRIQIGQNEGEGQQVDFVKRTGGGLNQLILKVDDLDAAVAKLEKAGIPVLMAQKGEDGKYLFAFMDTMEASGGNIPVIEVGRASH